MWTFWRTAPVWLTLSFGLAGCSEEVQESIKGGVKQAQQAVKKTVQSVQQPAGGSGSFELKLDKPIQAANCYATLVALGPGRSSVWQIASYQNPEEETFPAMLFHAEVAEQSLDKLVNKTVRGQMFVQLQKDGSVLHSSREQPVEVTIHSLQDGNCVAEIVSGELVDTETGKKINLTGKLTAIVAQ
jgi:hypothetical protein